MYKIVEAGGWDKLREQGIMHPLPFLKSGEFTRNDQRLFFQKTAASEKFLHEMGTIKLADGDIPIHVNAIGATEFYNCNRKADAFNTQTCRDWHHTFVTEGRNYLHHQNKNPEYNFGKVASSCFNEDMKRVELLVVSNGTAAAAKRNGGYVLPNEFLSKIEKNAEIPVSMGCHILYDYCVLCGNKSRTIADYCDANTCRDPKTGEYFPGCKNGLTKVLADGRQQYVENVEPHFFDISFVGVPADRTGYGFYADYLNHPMQKSASIEEKDWFGVPKYSGWTRRPHQQGVAILKKLAEMEQAEKDIFFLLGANAVRQDAWLGRKLASLPYYTKMASLRLLSENGVLLSPENFVVMLGLEKTAADDLRNASSDGIHSAMYRKYSQVRPENPMTDLFMAIQNANTSMKTASLQFTPSDYLRYEITAEQCRDAAWLCRLPGLAKQASIVHPSHRELAEAYVLYKVAALNLFPANKREFGLRYAASSASQKYSVLRG